MTILVDDLPGTIRVGPHDIAITYLTDEEAKEDFGYFKTGELTIGISREFVTGSMAVDTVVHELLHAIWFTAIKDESSPEERAVATVATQLTQVIRDNPELIKWLQNTVNR
jgi:hypothetical protein